MLVHKLKDGYGYIAHFDGCKAYGVSFHEAILHLLDMVFVRIGQ